ncbi:MAG TPA: hypothetical protein VKR54_03330 [Candidatus Babeliales bacterium]|jgi:hypothetical protein|nr:hypothetical protein [Candidatus Babeliales bacterium]
MNNDSFSHDSNSQFALSYELLHLLKWLGQHDTDKLKKIISKAVAHGLHDNIQKTISLSDHNILEEMHHGIIDFFEILDTLLANAINDHVEQKAREKNLLPTIDHFDSSLLDDETLRCSVENTTKKLDLDPHMNPKEQLCKEFLKKWKPLNKQSMH